MSHTSILSGTYTSTNTTRSIYFKKFIDKLFKGGIITDMVSEPLNRIYFIKDEKEYCIRIWNIYDTDNDIKMDYTVYKMWER